jgi:hypothetical protein
MAIADPLSRLSRQEHRVDNLDLPLRVEILLSELPDDIKKLERFCVNAEKDTNVATRIVQRWRTLSNPISNTIGGTEGTDFLIAAPYADKLPLKVAEYIRQDVPFAILVPLSLLNEIDRVGKKEVDELIRSRRLRMKLIISSSLGQAWLINHPSCRMDTSTHPVFFTETPNALNQLVIDAIDRLMTGGMTHEYDAFATLTPREMRAKRREKERQNPTDQSKGQGKDTACENP